MITICIKTILTCCQGSNQFKWRLSIRKKKKSNINAEQHLYFIWNHSKCTKIQEVSAPLISASLSIFWENRTNVVLHASQNINLLWHPSYSHHHLHKYTIQNVKTCLHHHLATEKRISQALQSLSDPNISQIFHNLYFCIRCHYIFFYFVFLNGL